MLHRTLALLLTSGFFSTEVHARGDGTFQAPLSIVNAGRPGPVTLHAGDFNNDGKMDLVTANGSPSILIFFQNPTSRLDWKSAPLRVGSQVYYVRAADFDGNGFDDIVAGDISATAFIVRSRGDGSFERPEPLRDKNDPDKASRGARWTAVGDWNNDGKMDVATANISAADLTVFLGDGQGAFTMSQLLPGSREHSLEALDYDGDGKMDLALGTGLNGITLHKGNGDGTFAVKDPFISMGCVEYFAEVGHFEGAKYVLKGDFNLDGRGDLAPTCVETTTASAGISLGNATYTETLETLAGRDVDSTAMGDLNGDGKPDLAIVSKGTTALLVHIGKGDGTFLPGPVSFGATGDTPDFLITRDMDADGLLDVVSADFGSSSITLFWGRSGDRFLESTLSLTGFTAAKAMAVADFDRDGTPDLFFPRSDQAQVNVYLRPALSLPALPTFVIPTESKYSLLEVVDLNGDGVPDLAGADSIAGTALVALLDATGKASGQLALAAGISPATVQVGLLDAGPTPDIAVPCKGSNHVALFLGQGAGAFANARILPTVDKPKGAAIGNWDGDAFVDLAVISDTVTAIHYGIGGGDFSEPAVVLQDATKLFTDVAAGDLNGDGVLDVVVSESKTASVLSFHGKGSRAFEAPVSIRTHSAPTALALGDLNGDGRLDITISSSTSRSAAALINEGPAGFPGQLVYQLGIAAAGHRLADLDVDGALDLAAFAPASATILLGRSAASATKTFRRGDVNGDGVVDLSDPVTSFTSQFLGGGPPICLDSSDADDTGAVNITDPIYTLNYLFLGGSQPPAPGPLDCGEDTSEDELNCAEGCAL